MDRFSTNVQIKSNIPRTGFIESFVNIIKKRGFVPCSEEEATLTYVLAFSDGWVTITNKDYTGDPGKANRDMADITAALKTSAFALVTFGNIFAYMQIKDHTGTEETIAVGSIAGRDGIEGEWNRSLWEPLLADGKTWEQFTELRSDDVTAVNDLPGKTADVFGIDSGYIYADIGDLWDIRDSDNNIESGFFRETDEKSLKSNFIDVFGDALEPIGFKNINGKFPYFVRVVPGGEVIHIITYMEEWCPYPGQKQFNILSGIATVYRYKIDLDRSPDYNSAWLHTNSQIYSVVTSGDDYDNDYRLSICHFVSDENKGISVRDAMEYALELTRRFALPLLSTAFDIRSCMKYLKKTEQSCSTAGFNSRFEFDKYDEYNEGLLYVKTDDEELKTYFRNIIDGKTPSDDAKRQRITEANRFFDDPVIHEKVLLELERRKEANTEILRSYGLSV